MTATLTEFNDYVGSMHFEIVEDAKGAGPMIVRGVVQRSGVKNANGRIYTDPLWERVLSDQTVCEALKRRRMLGEVEHPKDGATNLSRTSHIITKLDKRGSEIWGEAEVLNTPQGKIIQELFRSGVEVGISSRGRGTSAHRNGVEYVDETTYRLDTFDFVFKPSTPGAYPKLQEAQLEGAYKQGSTMDEKTQELKRLEVRAMDLTKGIESADFDSLTTRFRECAELRANIASLVPLLEGDESEEAVAAASLAGEIIDKVDEAHVAVTSALDVLQEQRTTELDRLADNAVEGILPDDADAKDEVDGVAKAPAKSGKLERQVVHLSGLLSEAREQRDYFMERFDEMQQILSESEEATMQRYVAAKGLSEELLTKLQESTGALEELAQDHAALEDKFEASFNLNVEVSKRQDRARLTREVREAIEDTPDLAKFRRSLQESIDSDVPVEQLHEQINEYREALDIQVPAASKEEAMASQVTIHESFISDDDDDDDPASEERLGEDAELPSGGDAINEEVDAAVLTKAGGGGAFRLDETVDDRNVAVGRAVVNARPGWK
jgi:hypothetical protein